MSKNKIQFQRGMSMQEFTKQYGTEGQCIEALASYRWPSGFECSNCGCRKYCFLRTNNLYQCNKCDKQISITSGTIFHSTKLPLTTWFLAIYLMTQSKNGISQLELARQVGVSSNTGASMYHKIAQVMLEREDSKPLSGGVEIDDAYWGGKKKGKRGRGSTNKTPFIAAVEKVDSKPSRIKLNVVSRFSKAEIYKWATKNLDKGTSVLSDGLNCFPAVKDAGCLHTAIIVGNSKDKSKTASFNWVNTILGNLKTALAGTFHKLHPKHLKRHLATFAYRFNRRYKLGGMIARFAYIAVRTAPCPKWFLSAT
jgi:transposase-like protein